MNDRTDDRTDPRKTRRLINAMCRGPEGWDKLFGLIRAETYGAVSDWVDPIVLAVEADQRKKLTYEGLDWYREHYEDDEPRPLDLEDASAEVKGHAPRYLITQGGDLLGMGDTPAEAAADATAHAVDLDSLAPSECYTETAPHKMGGEDLGTADPIYLVRTSDALTPEHIEAETFEVVNASALPDTPDPDAETSMLATPAVPAEA